MLFNGGVDEVYPGYVRPRRPTDCCGGVLPRDMWYTVVASEPVARAFTELNSVGGINGKLPEAVHRLLAVDMPDGDMSSA